jgi:hypothetical protein
MSLFEHFFKRLFGSQAMDPDPHQGEKSDPNPLPHQRKIPSPDPHQIKIGAGAVPTQF